jgi:integrase
MGRNATGSVRKVRGKWLATLRGEYIGSFDTEQEARDLIAAALKVDADKAPDSLHVFGEKWLNDRETGGDIRGISQERSVWLQHVTTAKFYDWPLRRIRPVDCQAWLNDLSQKCKVTVKRTKAGVVKKTTDERIGRQTVKHARRVLSNCFRSAVIAGKLTVNPITQCITPKMAKVTEDDEAWTFLTAPEIDKLFAAIELAKRPGRKEFYRAWYSVAIYGGLRLEEIKALRWEDIRHGELRLRRAARKGRSAPLKEKCSRRNVPMLRPLREALEVWKRVDGVVRSHGLVFPADPKEVGRGSCYGDSYDAAWEKYWRAKATHRDHVRHHDLRHTCGSHLVIGTWGRAFSLMEVRDWLGHADISTSQRYAHLSPGGLLNSVRDMEARKPSREREQ